MGCSKYPTAAFVAVGAPKKPFHNEERLEEFRKAAEATPEEVAAFLEAWGLE
jgi:hypothetical protein